MPVLCDAIHDHFEQTDYYKEKVEALSTIKDKNSKAWLKAEEKQYPLCLFPYEIEFAIRQYDPEIRLLFNRNLRLFYEGNTSTGISYNSSNRRYMWRKTILDAMYGRNPDLTLQEFVSAMNMTKTQYLIVEEHLANGSFLVNAGCRQIGVVAGYTIFCYGI